MSKSDAGGDCIDERDLAPLKADHISDERSGTVTIYRDDIHDPDNTTECTGWITAESCAVFERGDMR